jgi:hypothetical protein
MILVLSRQGFEKNAFNFLWGGFFHLVYEVLLLLVVTGLKALRITSLRNR